MIKLLSLTTNDFKQLKDLQLRFPEKGSILVEGRNEAGKSTLFEAIFFGLFGRPLVSDTKMEDLVGYGATEGLVELAINVSGRRFDILRKVKNRGNNVTRLKITDPDGDVEQVTGPTAVNRRIAEEICLDPDAFLNSCFVEQKKLEKLEGMNSAQREASLMRLLNLDRMLEEEKALKITIEDRRQLDRQEQRLKLARVMAEIPSVKKRGREIKHLLDILPLKDGLASLETLHSSMVQAEERAAALKEPIQAAEKRIAHIGTLRSASQAATTALVRLETIRKHTEDIQALGIELAGCEKLEHEELPALRRQRRSWGLLRSHLARCITLSGASEEIAVDAQGIRQRQKAVADARHLVLTSEAGLSSLDEPIALAREHLGTAQTLRATLAEMDVLTVRWDKIQNAQQDREHLQREREELDRLEREEMPQFRMRRARLQVLRSQCTRLKQWDALAREAGEEAIDAAQKWQRIQAIEKEIRDLEHRIVSESEQVTALENQEKALLDRERLVRLAHALEDWVSAAEASRSMDALSRQVSEAENGLDAARETARAAESREVSARAKGRTGYVKASAGLGLGVILAAVGAATGLTVLFVLAALAATVGIPFLLGAVSSGRALSVAAVRRAEAESEVRERENAFLRLQGHYDSAKSSQGAAAGRLEMACLRLEGLGEPAPESVAHASRRLQEITSHVGEEDGDTNSQLAEMRDRLTRQRGSLEEMRRSRAALRAEAETLSEPVLRETIERCERRRDRIRETIICRWAEKAEARAVAAGLDPEMVARYDFSGIAQALGMLDTQEKMTRERIASRPAVDQRLDSLETLIQAELDLAGNSWSSIAPHAGGIPLPETRDHLDKVREGIQSRLADANEEGTRAELARLEQQRNQHQGNLWSARRDLLGILQGLVSREETSEPASRLLHPVDGADAGHAWAALDKAVESLADDLEKRYTSIQERVMERHIPRLRTRAERLGMALGHDMDASRNLATQGEARVMAQIRVAERRLEDRATLRDQIQRLTGMMAMERTRLDAMIPDLRTAVPDLPGLNAPDDARNLQTRLAEDIESLDETGTRTQLEDLRNQFGQAESLRSGAERDIQRVTETVRRGLTALGARTDVPLEEAVLTEEIPAWASADPSRKADYEIEFDELRERHGYLTRTRSELAEALDMDPNKLDLDPLEEEDARDQMLRDIRVREMASRILTLARGRIMSKVMPYTIEHMRRILPTLTMDRYHDADLTEDYKIRVWDERAAQWKSKNIFSGGTRDQFSLALRLAFAIATLPQERGSAPSFIFLDEPLSSFDAERSSALMYLLTNGEIAESFDQIFVISHSQVIEADAFSYRLRLDNGRLAEPTSEELKATAGQPDLLSANAEE